VAVAVCDPHSSREAGRESEIHQNWQRCIEHSYEIRLLRKHRSLELVRGLITDS